MMKITFMRLVYTIGIDDLVMSDNVSVWIVWKCFDEWYICLIPSWELWYVPWHLVITAVEHLDMKHACISIILAILSEGISAFRCRFYLQSILCCIWGCFVSRFYLVSDKRSGHCRILVWGYYYFYMQQTSGKS